MTYKTCVSIAEKTPKKLKQTLTKALKKSEYAEIRFDFLNPNTVPEALHLIRKDLRKCVCTLRPIHEGGKFSDSAYAYSAKYGCYNYGGNCVSLQQIFAKKRKFPAFTQAQALETVRDQLIAGVKLEFFVEQLITKPTKRLNFAKKLRKRAIAAKYERETILVL